MKNDLHIVQEPAAMPLIRSIAVELRERCLRIMLLQALLDIESDQLTSDRRRLLVAEMATNRRSLRNARAEMERVGYSILSLDPLGVCVRDSSDPSCSEIELAGRIQSRAS